MENCGNLNSTIFNAENITFLIDRRNAIRDIDKKTRKIGNEENIQKHFQKTSHEQIILFSKERLKNIFEKDKMDFFSCFSTDFNKNRNNIGQKLRKIIILFRFFYEFITNSNS